MRALHAAAIVLVVSGSLLMEARAETLSNAEKAATLMFAQGYDALKQGRPADAEKFFRAGLSLQPDNDQANFYLGEALAAIGSPDQAIIYYRKASAAAGDLGQRARDRIAQLPAQKTSLPAAPLQVDQFYEQFRTAGHVTGGCDDMLKFSASLQQLLLGKWSYDGPASFVTGARRSVQVQKSVTTNVYTGFLAIPTTTTYMETEYQDCNQCCLIKYHIKSSINISGRDQMGGLVGTVHGERDQYDSQADANIIGCHAEEIGTNDVDITVTVPVQQSGDKCLVEMPIIHYLSDNSEARLTILRDTVVRWSSAGESPRTYTRTP